MVSNLTRYKKCNWCNCVKLHIIFIEIDFHNSKINDFCFLNGFYFQGPISTLSEYFKTVSNFFSYSLSQWFIGVSTSWQVVPSKVLIRIYNFPDKQRYFYFIILLFIRYKGAIQENCLIWFDTSIRRFYVQFLSIFFRNLHVIL